MVCVFLYLLNLMRPLSFSSDVKVREHYPRELSRMILWWRTFGEATAMHSDILIDVFAGILSFAYSFSNRFCNFCDSPLLLSCSINVDIRNIKDGIAADLVSITNNTYLGGTNALCHLKGF